MQKPNAVKLNANEIHLAKQLANERHTKNRKAGIPNRKRGPQSEEVTELDGVGGEIAFAKALNLYPDLKDYPGKHDMVIAGKTVDVKTTRYPGGHLEVSTDKNPGDVDIYALVIGEMPDYQVVGWMCGDRLMNKKRLYTHRSGSKVYRASQSELKEFEVLW
jgi:hypothetical protein|tara:strand:- start:1310 stop:1792 length:483 start_codon:yes stop_codon:yes gene_type:complete